jgi:hypothetical protein
VNLPTQDIINSTKFWLQNNNIPQLTINQISQLMKVASHQNYFQYSDRYYKPSTGIAMESPLSSTATELYLQYFEELVIKHWLDT